MAVTMIELENVSVHFPNWQADDRYFRLSLLKRLNGRGAGQKYFSALKSISLKIEEGDRVGLAGPNGAGKTTLLKVISNILPANEGNVTFRVSPLALLDIGAGLNEDLNALDNIKILAILYGVARSCSQSDIEEIIKFAGLEEARYKPIRNYSSGMRLRLAFSAITHWIPEALVLDEWLAVGDAEFQKKCVERLNKLVGISKVFVMASHNLDLLRSLCNRIVHLDHGEIANVEILG